MGTSQGCGMPEKGHSGLLAAAMSHARHLHLILRVQRGAYQVVSASHLSGPIAEGVSCRPSTNRGPSGVLLMVRWIGRHGSRVTSDAILLRMRYLPWHF